MPAHKRVVFVTVGTTQFDRLPLTLLQEEVLVTLARQGYDCLRLQIGRGSKPVLPSEPPLHIEWYRFKPSLDEDMRSASLIVSHAGAGSILEALRLRQLLLVVVNDELMDNHQEELAGELAARGHLVATKPAGLLAALSDLSNTRNLTEFPEADPTLFPSFLCSALGVEGTH